MVRWPSPDRMSKVSVPVMERFKKTAGAKDLEQDPRDWVLANWPWFAEPPYEFIARASDFEERTFVMDLDGLWTASTKHPLIPPKA